MSQTWIGGHPDVPSYYLYKKNVNFFWFKTKKIKYLIISSNEYNKLNKEDRLNCTGATVRDVKKHGNQEMKKRADGQFAARLTGLNF